VRGDLDFEAVGFNDLVKNGLDHIEIVLADIRQRHLDVVKLRYAQNICKELFCEADAPRPDYSDFETHNATSFSNGKGETGQRILASQKLR